MAANPNHWIAGATANKGGLHRSLHVPEGNPIPKAKINKAEHANNPKVAKQARLAATLEHMHRKCGGSV